MSGEKKTSFYNNLFRRKERPPGNLTTHRFKNLVYFNTVR